MIGSLVSLFIAIGVISFLIFIHELGHYLVARRVGIRVEAFSIGLGRPIISWERDGVEWRVGWIPFGGYVKMYAGEDDETVDPYTLPDGYFGRPPADRIKVSLAGPVANLLFAFLVFTLLWAFGGRTKNFSDISPVIGWLDQQSTLFREGVRPGDEITVYDDHAFRNAQDNVIEPTIAAGGEIRVRGFHVDPETGQRSPFDLLAAVYPHPLLLDREVQTAGVLQAASYLIYSPDGPEREPSGLAAGSPLLSSGIQPGDRVVWANGELIFSQMQLSNILNDSRVLVTIQRDTKTLLRRVPRVLVQELRVDSEFREELIDWQYEAQLQRKKIVKLYAIPYYLAADGTVDGPLRLIEADQQEKAFPTHPVNVLDEPLELGDRIVAVSGAPVQHAYQILTQLQEPKLLLVVLRAGNLWSRPILSQEAREQLMQQISLENLHRITSSIGNPQEVHSSGELYLLNPITPKVHRDFAVTPEAQAHYAAELSKRRSMLEAIDNPEVRAQYLQLLEKSDDQLHLGPPYFVDRKTVYNPSPFLLFRDVFEEISRTLSALLSGRLNPKWLAGPVAIVQVVQENWQVSAREALFWVGAISMNLGLLNLLPIPVLDGGAICFSLFELGTGRRLKPKTMERLIIPFAILILAFLVFLTYQDLLRILSKWLAW